MILTLIHQDHVRISRLLKVLEQKLAALRTDEREINYQLLQDVIDYLQNYADMYHHPLEDVIYDYYLEHKQGEQPERVLVDRDPAERSPAERSPIHPLQQQHDVLRQKTQELRDLVDMILLDAIVPRDEFIERLAEFISLQETHLNYEETNILPMLERELSEDDWKNIEAVAPVNKREDPLFGIEVSQRYRNLAERIRQSEHQDS